MSDLYGGLDPRNIPTYSIGDAARYLRIPSSTISSWTIGYSYPVKDGSNFFHPLIELTKGKNKPYLLSFTNLVEVHVLRAIRQHHKIQLNKVREALDFINERFEVPHPLAQEDFRTNGKDNSIPKASLHLTFDENRYLYVCNIVPVEMGQLGEENYNLILENFLTKFIEPAVNDLDIKIVTTPAEKNIDNSMSPELSAKLKNFSLNKSTGIGHPCDQKRFFDFIIQAHRESSLLDESTLKQLLLDEGWSEYFTDDLSSKYCFGRELLKQYDS